MDPPQLRVSRAKPGKDSRLESSSSGAKLLLTVPETAMALGLGRSKVYDLISKGDIPSVKIHGSRRVPVDKLSAWIDSISRSNRDLGRSDKW